MGNDLGVPVGWRCPQCGAVFAPFCMACLNCTGKTYLRHPKGGVVRKAVVDFTFPMESRLRSNDDRGGWEDCSLRYLLEAIHANINDIKSVVGEVATKERVQVVVGSCTDIANFSMMIADNAEYRTKGKFVLGEEQ